MFRNFSDMSNPVKVLTVLSFLVSLIGIVFLTLGTFRFMRYTEYIFVPCFAVEMILQAAVCWLKKQKFHAVLCAFVGVLMLCIAAVRFVRTDLWMMLLG